MCVRVCVCVCMRYVLNECVVDEKDSYLSQNTAMLCVHTTRKLNTRRIVKFLSLSLSLCTYRTSTPLNLTRYDTMMSVPKIRKIIKSLSLSLSRPLKCSVSLNLTNYDNNKAIHPHTRLTIQKNQNLKKLKIALWVILVILVYQFLFMITMQ